MSAYSTRRSMIRVLLIARYPNPTWRRKVALLAGQPDLQLKYVCPLSSQDALIKEFSHVERLEWTTVKLGGRVADPHRLFYRTWTFGLRTFSPDLIHAEEEPDSLAALQIALARQVFAPKAKLILYTWQNVDRPKRWYVKAVLRTTLRASDAVLCANREAVELARRSGYRKPVELLPAIGVDTRVFQPLPAARRAHAQFTLGYVGRLVPEKSVDTLVEAVARIPSPVRVLIVGDGPQRPALEAQARPLGDRVQFLGALPPAQTARHIQQLDALVLPSRTTPVWKEQFGRVLTEAMACQVPVIGSNSGAIPEVMGDAGLIFPEGDAAALAHCLEQLIESPDLGRELGERGYARVMQHYTQERIVEQTAEFYRHIVQAG